MPNFRYFYTGQTDNLERRLLEHNNTSKGKKYTSKKGPWQLIYSQEFDTRAKAMQREKFLKGGQGREFLKKVMSNPPQAGRSRVRIAPGSLHVFRLSS
ncbi:MAG: GIY-YIG nuclease family protein [Bacteroidetes bacterium]|nr:GIY-YIG nuclease family protein [Bacteroidota bacterium]